MPRVFGARVRQARIFRGLSGVVVMEHMGWRSPRQTRLEKSDTATLDDRELDMLAAFLGFPAVFFTTAPLSRVTSRDLLLRAPKSMPAGEREYLAALANLAGDLTVALDARQALPPVGLEPLPTGVGIVDAAAVTRDWLGVPPSVPITSLIGAVESAGVPVIMRPLRDAGSDWEFDAVHTVGLAGLSWADRHLGCSARAGADRERPVVLVRAVDSWEHTRWAVAHEIGHLVLHRYGDLSAREEREASLFAAELLAPAAALAAELPAEPTLGDLLEAKLRWRISVGALTVHLRESRLVDAERADSLRRQLYSRINPDTGHTWGKTEPGGDAYPPERPHLLGRYAETSYGTETLESGALGYPPDLLATILSGPAAVTV